MKTDLEIKQDMGIARHDTEGGAQCTEYKAFNLVNVYVPNSGQELPRLHYRKKWDAYFLKYLKAFEQTKLLITVDLKY